MAEQQDPKVGDATEGPEGHLAGLGSRFLRGLELRAAGRVDQAVEIFREVLAAEPRLAEPRLELGRVHLEMGQLEDAELEAREAIRILEGGGQWTDDLPENVVLGMAWALLGEVLKERAASDEVVFGAPESFRELLAQSKAAFQRAHELDPSDDTSWINAEELGEAPEPEELGEALPPVEGVLPPKRG